MRVSSSLADSRVIFSTPGRTINGFYRQIIIPNKFNQICSKMKIKLLTSYPSTSSSYRFTLETVDDQEAQRRIERELALEMLQAAPLLFKTIDVIEGMAALGFAHNGNLRDGTLTFFFRGQRRRRFSRNLPSPRLALRRRTVPRVLLERRGPSLPTRRLPPPAPPRRSHARGRLPLPEKRLEEACCG